MLALWGVTWIYMAMQSPPILVLTLFGLGEISAVLALDHRQATHTEHWLVMAALIVLPIVTGLAAIAANSFAWGSRSRGTSEVEPRAASPSRVHRDRPE